jgi:serine/threonine protein kinase
MIDDDQTEHPTLYSGSVIPSANRNLSELTPGAILGERYLIEKELGRGGIGIVYLARDQRIHGRPVVIKLLLEELARHDSKAWFEKKFKEEIKALSKITHPGVVRVLDMGELTDGRSYLVMQHISGDSLRDHIGPQGMELQRAARLVRQIGQALAGAHEQGVLHRDLKPENIMLQNIAGEEYIKIIDFGIATVLDKTMTPETRITAIAGTVAYMAPEQLIGKPSAASDIYALGTISYEMLTGRLPYNPASIYQLLELQRAGVRVKPCEVRPDLPEAAQTAILKALSFNPEDRQKRAGEFSDALAEALEAGKPTEIREARSGFANTIRAFSGSQKYRTRRVFTLISVLLVTALLAVASWLYMTSIIRLPPAEQSVEELRLNYSLTVQKNPKRYPGSMPFQAPRGMIFEAGDQVRLNLSSPQEGFLYIINERPVQANGLPLFNVLFPNFSTNDGSAEIKAHQSVQVPEETDNPDMDWFVFDEEEGAERIWLIWSTQSVTEIEAVKGKVNPIDHGVISDPDQRLSIAEYLSAHSENPPEPEENRSAGLISFKGKGEVLVALLKLEHRRRK